MGTRISRSDVARPPQPAVQLGRPEGAPSTTPPGAVVIGSAFGPHHLDTGLAANARRRLLMDTATGKQFVFDDDRQRMYLAGPPAAPPFSSRVEGGEAVEVWPSRPEILRCERDPDVVFQVRLRHDVPQGYIQGMGGGVKAKGEGDR